MSSAKPLAQERRQAPRINKNYIIRFVEKNNAALKYEISQIENISRGGLCFSSTVPFGENVILSIELRTPFLSESVFVEGQVLQSREKIKGLVYENRLKFNSVSPRVLELLDKIERQHNAKKALA